MIISHQHLLTLSGIKGFGPKKINTVAEILRNEEIEQLSDKDLCDVINDMIGKRILKGVKDFHQHAFMEAADTAKRILEKTFAHQISMVSRYDESYPTALLYTNDEYGRESIPPFLFYKGDISVTNRKSIAIIGTREPSIEGEIASEFFAKKLAEKGVNIVSGLALGCDTFAHKGALEVHGITTAILGGGLDKIYPSENAELAERILEERGLVFTEYPVGEATTTYSLVARDRLQAALSQAIIVIQTDVNGGSMHAVKSAFAAHKAIFGVVYKKDLHDEHIGGNKLLIQKSIAKPIYCTEENISLLISAIDAMPTPEGTQLSLF